jgi:hypothetical protein
MVSPIGVAIAVQMVGLSGRVGAGLGVSVQSADRDLRGHPASLDGMVRAAVTRNPAERPIAAEVAAIWPASVTSDRSGVATATSRPAPDGSG